MVAIEVKYTGNKRGQKRTTTKTKTQGHTKTHKDTHKHKDTQRGQTKTQGHTNTHKDTHKHKDTQRGQTVSSPEIKRDLQLMQQVDAQTSVGTVASPLHEGRPLHKIDTSTRVSRALPHVGHRNTHLMKKNNLQTNLTMSLP